MLNAAEIRANAVESAEQNKIRAEQEAKEAEARKAQRAETIEHLVEEEIAAIVTLAAQEGTMSVAITIDSGEAEVFEAIVERLSEAGFDVAIARNTATEEEPGCVVFTLYWSKDRGGAGSVTRPKTVEI